MRVLPTELAEVRLIEPTVHRDPRGFFLESYHAARYAEAGVVATFVQDNHSRSGARTLRGLHGQFERPQGKLMRCTRGAVWDVAVDARRGSPTFGRWAAAELSSDNFRQLWIPPGFLHGFCVIGDEAEIEYKCTTVYEPTLDFAVRWNDPSLAIPWPLTDPVLSAKDAQAPLLSAVFDRLPAYVG